MLKGYLIEKYNSMGGAYTCARLVEEARAADVALDIVGVHDSMIRGSNVENRGMILEPRDFVINRYKWGHLKDSINGLAIRSYNSLEGFNEYIDKYAQLSKLESTHFIKPEYLLGTAQSDYDMLAAKLGPTFVAKGLRSSMGQEIRLIQSAADLHKLPSQLGSPEKEVLFEEFISSSYGRDIRLFCVRGEAVACMTRESIGDFRANVALGANIKAYPMTQQLQSIAADIYGTTGLDVIGIDLLFGKDELYLCEINVMPGIEGIEHASGKNIAAIIMNLVKEDFNR